MQYLTLILSSIVSFTAVLATIITTVCQINSQKKIKSMELYFHSKLEAYSNFHKAYTQILMSLKTGEQPNVQLLQSSAEIAAMLSSKETHNAILKFSSHCIEILDSSKNNENFFAAWNNAAEFMRQELFKYDYLKQKINKGHFSFFRQNSRNDFLKFFSSFFLYAKYIIILQKIIFDTRTTII